MKCYVFKPTDGRARMATDDETGAKLPKRRTGGWIREGDVEIVPGARTFNGASSDDVIAGIQHDGYYLWLDPEPVAPMRVSASDKKVKGETSP